ncbi:MAG: tyrosine-protein phosphatase [Chloroflexota bacterium]
MIDLHCHILPGLDDGPADADEALAMAALAVADGVRRVVATPHWPDPGAPFLARRDAVLAELRRLLAERGSPLQLSGGGEVLLEPDLAARQAGGDLPTLGAGPYLLVELPFAAPALPNYTGQVLAELQVAGLRPILAHPERCAALQRQPQQLAGLVERGLLVQVNAASLGGGHGGQARRCAEQWLQGGLVHVLATDAHDPRERPPVLSAAVSAAARLVGEAAALALVTITPAAILAGHAVRPPEPRQPRGRRWWFWPR